MILACFRDEGYIVEWRVINAAEYGYQQRRRRTFIFAYKEDTAYGKKIIEDHFSDDDVKVADILDHDGFFATTFPILPVTEKSIKTTEIPLSIGTVSESFKFNFENI